jgi:hypothetical protein
MEVAIVLVFLGIFALFFLLFDSNQAGLAIENAILYRNLVNMLKCGSKSA